jgi:DNA-binding NtrC family response regulator
MLAYDWPGNVRELANVVERAVALSDHDTLLPGDLRLGTTTGPSDFLDIAARRRMPLAEVERAYVRRVLESVDGNKAVAARVLGIDRRTVYRKLDEPEPGPDAGEG